mgnify:CR=1 FL=1
MPPKGGNAKKEAGRAKKAENEAKKAEAAAAERVRRAPRSHTFAIFNTAIQERKEAALWADDNVKGGKAKKAEAEEKRKADLARKAENARLLAEEEADAPAKVKSAPKAGKNKGKEPVRPAGPGAIAAGGGLGAAPDASGSKAAPAEEEVESYAATGIDNALDLLEVVTAKMDKASVGSQAAGLERHPEVRILPLLL